ncbi:hypothetical protein BDN72DRAFT_835997 [Pluteus cervinus]|uniref:Uncharacterized protein n=1 Tax=Pluteus cervinus TaxID=181527 RepID=A0ACD3B4X4_9AGAR|nr:hypothetical protein BDN72DRAFT_835997 [Pluteus cervinus]
MSMRFELGVRLVHGELRRLLYAHMHMRLRCSHLPSELVGARRCFIEDVLAEKGRAEHEHRYTRDKNENAGSKGGRRSLDCLSSERVHMTFWTTSEIVIEGDLNHGHAPQQPLEHGAMLDVSGKVPHWHIPK